MADESKTASDILADATQEVAKTPAATVTDKTTKADLLAMLKQAEETIAKQDAEIQALEQAGALKYSPKEMPIVGPDGGYKFVVGPKLSHAHRESGKYAHLKAVTVQCTDESEAVRWYCQKHEERPGSGKPVDPVRVRIQAECVDERRKLSVLRQKRISALRKKVELGASLSADDQALLKEVEDDLFQY